MFRAVCVMELLPFAALRAEEESRFLAAAVQPWVAPRTGLEGPPRRSTRGAVIRTSTSSLSSVRWPWPVRWLPQGSPRQAHWAHGTGAVGSGSNHLHHRDASKGRAGVPPLQLRALPGVIVAYGNPKVVLAAQPVCGCDACDDGSAPLIEAIDEAFESVVLGEVLIDHGKRSARVVILYGESTSTSASPAATWVIGRWSGAPWLD